MIVLFYKLKEMQYGRIVLFAFFCVAVTPFVTHYYLTRRSNNEFDCYEKTFHTRTTLGDGERTVYRIEELKGNIDELERVKLSLKNELRELEGKRHNLLREIQDFSNNFENIRNKANHFRTEVQRRQQELESLRVAKRELDHCPQLPFLKPSKDLLLKLNTKHEEYPKSSLLQARSCTIAKCFNFQKCSFLKEFTSYVYNPSKLVINQPNHGSTRNIYKILRTLSSLDNGDKSEACVYVVVVGPNVTSSTSQVIEKSFSDLPFWRGDGHNHVIVNFAGDNVLKNVNTGRAIVVQPSFESVQYRQNFDIVIPPHEGLLRAGPVWLRSQPQLPAQRKFLLSFHGNHLVTTSLSVNSFVTVDDLKQLSKEAKDLNIMLTCETKEPFSQKHGWQLCTTHENRAKVLKQSTYALILQSEHSNDQTMTLIRFVEALQYGAIPVILTDNIILPFEGTINWRQAAVMIHNAQFPQVHFILRTIVVNDLLEMRRQGRFLWETYLSTAKAVLSTILATISTHTSLPAKPLEDVQLPLMFDKDHPPLSDSSVNFSPIVQNPIKSPRSFRNFTTNNVHSSKTWNTYPGALVSFQSEPFVPVLPSSAFFLNSSLGFQPLGNGAGGAGVEFQKALGGDYPMEQFTIVMLTYERELVLMEALGRLASLQYLNKVIVVWNSPNDPSPDLKWPNIGVSIEVVRPKKNSLNNRFLPFEQIETDAILSMDDDAHLRHDEMLFGFRVWREARDRIVGFPGRFHAWDLNFGGWLYNSNYSCELSMVLTGAAFFHKYYTYVYSYVMPEAIRNKVDEYTNCEDIALNFLVSHVTRKPPIKVTSRWTFRCPGCPQTLSQDETHFNERHKCINFFVEVYGYMPLLRTQFRADSVLFKTRLPHDKTKCFTYI